MPELLNLDNHQAASFPVLCQTVAVVVFRSVSEPELNGEVTSYSITFLLQ